MPGKRKEIVIFQHKKAQKTFIRDLNIFLSLLIVLLSFILAQKIVSHTTVTPGKSHTKSAPMIRKTVYAAEDIRVRIPILMYHYVENVQDRNDTIRIGLNIPPGVFEDQLVTMQNEGYIFLAMQDITAILSGTQKIPDKAVVLTFDDGYRDFYDVVFPLLKKHSVKAVSYVAPGLLNGPNYMDKDQIVDIAKSGLVEVGAHTVNHLALANASLQDVYYEVHESKAALEQLTGSPVTNFAYPYGSFDDKAVALVKSAGFDTAVTTEPGDDLSFEGRFVLQRVRPGARVGRDLLNFLKQTTFTAY
jgi:peptidoglycan/xylan/chitin deacetylase (PgdA/CDA1 family)